jgi:hydroxylysine kinase
VTGIWCQGVSAALRMPPAQAEDLLREHYGIDAAAERLASEREDTFRVPLQGGTFGVLRVSPADLVPAERSFQTELLLHLASSAPSLPVQRVIPASDGRLEVTLGSPPRVVRLTTYLEGELLGQAAAGTALRRDIGATLARLNQALRTFAHPGSARSHLWDLQNAPQLGELLGELPGAGEYPALPGVLGRFDVVVRPLIDRVPKQVIHTDFHGDNLLIEGDRVTGILDFNDALSGPVAMDVAVAACYQLGSGPDLLAPALDVVAGYHAVDPLCAWDLPLIAEFMVLRLAARIIVSQWSVLREPANSEYLLRRTPQAVRHLAALLGIPRDVMVDRLRAACGWE